MVANNRFTLCCSHLAVKKVEGARKPSSRANDALSCTHLVRRYYRISLHVFLQVQICIWHEKTKGRCLSFYDNGAKALEDIVMRRLATEDFSDCFDLLLETCLCGVGADKVLASDGHGPRSRLTEIPIRGQVALRDRDFIYDAKSSGPNLL
ncbi:hypothetical protein HG530_009267 [Fusarium avenaceum]|nr:hypothetical protein HG530_009267 [Fusarium avenaceum]